MAFFMAGCFCSVALAQCDICGAVDANHYGTKHPIQLDAVEPFICRVEVHESANIRGYGTGVLLAGEVPYVLTASHVAQNGAYATFCTFGGKSYPAEVAARRSDSDALVLRLRQRPPGLEGVPIGLVPVKSGEHLYAAGRGQTGSIRWQTGVKIDNSGRDWLTMSGHFRQGDSGGPLFVVRDGNPIVIGTGWGTRETYTTPKHLIYSTRVHVTRSLFGLETQDDEAMDYQGGTAAGSDRPMLVPGGSGPGQQWSAAHVGDGYTCPGGS